MAYPQLPDTHRYKARHNIRELGCLPRLALIPVLLVLGLGGLVTAMMIGMRPIPVGTPTATTVLQESALLELVAIFILGLGVPLLLAPVCKIGLLRLWGGRGRFCWVHMWHRMGYPDVTDHQLYLTRSEYWAANFLPILVTLAVLCGLLASGNLLIATAAIPAMPIRAMTMVFPLINLLTTLRYPRHSLFCEASCGGFEVYTPLSS